MLLRFQLPGSMLFPFRIRFGLYAVLARMGAVWGGAAHGTYPLSHKPGDTQANTSDITVMSRLIS